MNKTAFAAFIAQERKSAGLTQKELAEKLHVTDKAVSKWERALSFPDVTLLSPLAEALGVEIGELVACRRELPDTPDKSKEQEGNMKQFLEVVGESLYRERKRHQGRLAGVIVLFLATAGLLWYLNTYVHEHRLTSIYLKETVEDSNYLYVEEEGHLIRLKCGDEIDFDAITADEKMFQLDMRWNRKTYQGAVSCVGKTDYLNLGGLEDMEIAPDIAPELFGYQKVYHVPEKYYRNPYGEGFFCDYRFYLYHENFKDPSENYMETLLLIEDCISALVYDWDGDGEKDVVVRTQWPEKPYAVYQMKAGEIVTTWPETLSEEALEQMVCDWER